jgi:hypothetical protein
LVIWWTILVLESKLTTSGTPRNSQEAEVSEPSDIFTDSYLVQSEYLRFTTKLNDVLHDILKHGFGEAVIRISIQKENKRTIVIESGKSYQYTVNLSEMQK